MLIIIQFKEIFYIKKAYLHTLFQLYHFIFDFQEKKDHISKDTARNRKLKVHGVLYLSIQFKCKFLYR